jgi:hypothetical protein
MDAITPNNHAASRPSGSQDAIIVHPPAQHRIHAWLSRADITDILQPAYIGRPPGVLRKIATEIWLRITTAGHQSGPIRLKCQNCKQIISHGCSCDHNTTNPPELVVSTYSLAEHIDQVVLVDRVGDVMKERLYMISRYAKELLRS